jgi:hypothetical protein
VPGEKRKSASPAAGHCPHRVGRGRRSERRCDIRFGPPISMSLLGLGRAPHRTDGNSSASAVLPSPNDGIGRDQKSPLRRCFKSRPPRRAKFAGFVSGYRSAPTAFRPLVRTSADRHATTGTCEIGQFRMYGKKLSYASENCLTHQKIFESAREAKMNQKLNRAPLARELTGRRTARSSPRGGQN